MNIMTRRRCLLAISQALAASALSACNGSPTAAVQDARADTEMLALLVFDLFPHEALEPEVYISVAEHISAQDNAVIAAGLENLRGRMGSWIDTPEEERLRILESLENSEFFATLRNLSVTRLYRQPAVWALLGYGGSAVEHGGYINRGFDDIAWLPLAGEG